MALLASTHLHASLHRRKHSRNSLGSWYTGKIRTSSAFLLLGAQSFHITHDKLGNDALRGTKSLYRFLFNYLTSALLTHSSRQSSVTFSTFSLDYDYCEGVPRLDAFDDDGMNISCIDYLLRLLHECANNVFSDLQCLTSARIHSKLAKAWLGLDFGLCHKRIAYKVAIYALLKTVMDMGSMFEDEHPMSNIFSQTVNMIREDVEDQLSKSDLKFVKWFRMEQVPPLTKHLTPLFERWTSICAKSSMMFQEEKALSTKRSSDIAAIFLAISCCIAVSKLGAVHTASRTFIMALPGMISKLLNLSQGLASIGALHHLATKEGLENEFLSHFGSKVLHEETKGEIFFWMGLIVEKLIAAIGRESIVAYLQIFCNIQAMEKDLAVLGLFAFLGRKTRLFLTCMGIKDLDEPVKDFICYLECGILFVYPELSSMCVYDLFMEVVSEEIGWLDLYAAMPCMKHQERKRCKQHVIQAEKEIILSTVFTVFSDMFSSFFHYSNLSQQSLDAKLVEYLHGSKNLLNNCLEDYYAVYDKLCEKGRTSQIQFSESLAHTKILSTVISSLSLKDLHQKPGDLMTEVIADCAYRGVPEIYKPGCADRILDKLPVPVDTISHKSLLTRSSDRILSSTSDMWMGTRLLFSDLYIAIRLVQKQIFGHILTERERKRLSRTVTDFTCVIPVAILMLLPVTAIGHAAILTAIKKYMPNLIPSPYSTERLDIIKQLKRAKKIRAESWSNLNTPSAL